MFVIEDEWHGEYVGEFDSRDAALAELVRLAGLRWDEAPNLAPCMSWKTCGRRYQIHERQVSEASLLEFRQIAVLEIDANGVRWL